MSGEDIIDQLERTVSTYRGRVLAPAAFIIVTRAGSVVEAETQRLGEELRRRGLRTAAVVCVGARSRVDALPEAVQLSVPVLREAAGCEGLRTWREHVGVGRIAAAGPGPQTSAAAPAAGSRAPAWIATAAGRLLLFAGKGGVGKSTCAAAAALVLAESRDVLLCSTDPAGSLSDVLGTTAERPAGRLRVLQIEPAAHQERLRASYEEEIAAALERLGLSESAALDRRVLETLWDLSPPGLDELAATAAMLGASRSGETVVIDSSPTGHFLRLLEMPDIGLGWTRQLMRVIVKYGMAGAAGGAAEVLLELSRDLRALRDTLHDPSATAVIIITLPEPAVQAETQRLAAALANADVRVAGVLLNRAADGDGADVCAIREWSRGAAMLRAPDVDPPPVGLPALRGFLDAWNIVG
jgi:arsenite-transporting ATPase